MRKITGLVLFISLVICSAVYADGKTVAEDRTGSYDYYADGVRGVTPGDFAARNASKGETVDRTATLNEGSSKTPGADKVSSTDTGDITGESTSFVDTVAQRGYSGNIEATSSGSRESVTPTPFAPSYVTDIVRDRGVSIPIVEFKDIPGAEGRVNLHDIVTVDDNGGIRINTNIVLNPDQSIIIEDNEVTLATGDEFETLVYGPAGDINGAILFSGGSVSRLGIMNPGGSVVIGGGSNNDNIGTVSGGGVSMVSENIGVLEGMVGGPIAGYEAITGPVGSSISVSATSEAVAADVVADNTKKNDDAKVLGIRNRQNKQSNAMGKLVNGGSIIDE